jgi:hypothetical protein
MKYGRDPSQRIYIQRQSHDQFIGTLKELAARLAITYIAAAGQVSVSVLLDLACLTPTRISRELRSTPDV